MTPLFFTQQDWDDYHHPPVPLTPMQQLYEEGKALERQVEDDYLLIHWLREMGLWVVVCHQQKYCRFTDAFIPGTHKHMEAAGDDPYELNQLVNDLYSANYVDGDITYELLAPLGHRETCPLLTHLDYYDSIAYDEDIPF